MVSLYRRNLLKQTEHGWTGRPLRIKSMARDRHESNISGEVKLLPFLTFKSSIALDLVRNQSDSFRPSYYLDGDEYSTYAGASRSVANKDYWVFDNYLTYNQNSTNMR